MSKHAKKAVCLFSGGLDSTTVLYYALSEGFQPFALTFDYGQRHKKEIQAAKEITNRLSIEHQIVNISLPWGGSALTDEAIEVPRKKVFQASKEIPATYVPSRNIIFLSFAFSWAEVLEAEAVFIGVNQLDYSGYPDCRETFLRSFERTIQCGTKMGVEQKPIRILTPLLEKTKADIAKLALTLNVPFELTWSCYLGEEEPCGACDACLLREKGFREAGVKEFV